MKTKFFPTSVASPWGNGHAERSIRTIKEAARSFLIQENSTTKWDEYINYFTAAHNSSTSVYGFEPESLVFGYTKPNQTDLLQFWPSVESHRQYAELIFPIAERLREQSQTNANKGKYKN